MDVQTHAPDVFSPALDIPLFDVDIPTLSFATHPKAAGTHESVYWQPLSTDCVTDLMNQLAFDHALAPGTYAALLARADMPTLHPEHPFDVYQANNSRQVFVSSANHKGERMVLVAYTSLQHFQHAWQMLYLERNSHFDVLNITLSS